jgi:hypothetical protein
VFTYYETTISFSYLSYIIYAFPIILALALYKKIKRAYDLHIKAKANVNLFVFVLIICGFCLVNVFSLNKHQNHASLIQSGNYQSVSGIISEYSSEKVASRGETFLINDVQFSYNNVASPSYFFANRNYGDGVIKNGLHANIYYLSIGNTNHIVKIELQGR